MSQFLGMLQVANNLQADIDDVKAKIRETQEALDFARWLNKPGKVYDASGEAARLAKLQDELADLNNQMATVGQAFMSAGFSDLAVVGFPMGLDDQARRGLPAGGVGLADALAAYRRARTRLTAGALEPATSPLEIVVTLAAGTVFKIGSAAAAAAVPATATKTSMVVASEELFTQIYFAEKLGIVPEILLGFKIWGNKALVGTAYIRNILSIEATKIGARSPRALLAHFEAEGIANGATKVQIFGHLVVNPKLLKLDPSLLSRLGWEMEWIGDTLMLTKILK